MKANETSKGKRKALLKLNCIVGKGILWLESKLRNSTVLLWFVSRLKQINSVQNINETLPYP